MRKKTTTKAMAMCLTLAMVVGVLPQTGMPKAIAAETTDETQINGDSQVASGGDNMK